MLTTASASVSVVEFPFLKSVTLLQAKVARALCSESLLPSLLMSLIFPLIPWETASVANASSVAVLTPSPSLSGEGFGEGEGEGEGEGFGEGEGEGEGEGFGEGEGVGDGEGEGEGEGDGLVVSTVKVTELLASEPSILLLPAASENFELATEITPLVVLSAVGVKVAV